jgi:hypothetical protein
VESFDHPTKGRGPTFKRVWDDLRTLSDLFASEVIKNVSKDKLLLGKEMEAFADRADELVDRLYKYADAIKEGKL